MALARGGSGTVDVIEIDAASHGGVDDARDLRERASYGPAQSRYKIYIIDEAHMVTPQGFNALLKIIDADTAERSLEEARRELQRVAAVRVLVIEDEAVIALDVADIVRNAGHQVVGIAATEKAAVELAKQHSPHLVLADIQLRGSDSGIAAVNQIMRSMSVPVIFVTGYPERLLTGKQVEPAFVISKPFDPDLLRAAIAQALDTVSI